MENMRSEECIYQMTRLAIFEKQHEEQLQSVQTFFRSDYIGRHMIKNGFRITLAYLLALAGWGIYHSETLIVDIARIDIMNLVSQILFGYAVVLSIFLVITYAIQRVRYERAKEDLYQYQEMLRRLEELYEQEDEENSRLRYGGTRMRKATEAVPDFDIRTAACGYENRMDGNAENAAVHVDVPVRRRARDGRDRRTREDRL